MAGFLETQRRDLWWAQPLAVFTILTPFVVYATWTAFQNAHYHFGNHLTAGAVDRRAGATRLTQSCRRETGLASQQVAGREVRRILLICRYQR